MIAALEGVLHGRVRLCVVLWRSTDGQNITDSGIDCLRDKAVPDKLGLAGLGPSLGRRRRIENMGGLEELEYRADNVRWQR